MDPADASKGEGGGGGDGGGGGGRRDAWRGGKGKTLRVFFGCCFGLVLSLIASFLFSFVVGIAGLAIGRFSASAPVSVASTCRILSSRVDLRSSKVCELGTFNYKAKQVFYPPERSKYRCHYDYYWASIFEVEYMEYFSGQIFHAVAESPTEALPEDCRPGFGTAWRTRMKFKVNETYSCKYTLGSRKAEIYSDDLFHCLNKEPSLTEMIRRYYILLRRFLSEKETIGHNAVYLGLGAGVVCGFMVSMFLVVFFKSVSIFSLVLFRIWKGSRSGITAITTKLRRICLFVVYFSALGWVALQYWRIIGLNNLYFDSSIGERTA